MTSANPNGGGSLPTRPPNTPSSKKTETQPASAQPRKNISVVDAELSDDSFSDRLVRHRNPISSLLISFIVHTVLLVMLALLTRQLVPESLSDLTVQLFDEMAVEDPAVDFQTMDQPNPDQEPTPLENISTDLSTDDTLEQAANENISVELPESETLPSTPDPVSPAGTILSAAKGGGLKGRQSENRARLARKYGATEASEAAVENGLRWLIKHQNLSDGSWSFQHHIGECRRRCRHSGSVVSPNAATGLALLAFLGAGHTHKSGRYQGEVSFGLLFLKSRIEETKFGGSLSDDSMYGHGIATLALCEAYAMTGDPTLRGPCEKAIQFIVSAQHPKGGWRYRPGSPGDTSVTGWQLMALKSAQMSGIYIPAETMEKAEKYLDSVSESDGTFYAYQPGQKKTPTNTAIGLLMRMYLGWPREKGVLDQGADWLLSKGMSRKDIYHNYYATQVIHHLRMDGWDKWNAKLRDFLVKEQATRGHEKGSWHFFNDWGRSGGRLYSTAMAIMVLEVYYRYLPLYDDEIVNEYDSTNTTPAMATPSDH